LVQSRKLEVGRAVLGKSSVKIFTFQNEQSLFSVKVYQAAYMQAQEIFPLTEVPAGLIVKRRRIRWGNHNEENSPSAASLSAVAG
jgi:hypothetical protein